MEAAARWWIDRRGDVTTEDDPLPPGATVFLDHRDCREQGVRVRVAGTGEELLGLGDLDDFPEVHHRDAVAHLADDREVVRDEDVREPEVVLEVVEQVDDLRLDRDVKSRDGLVADD